LQGLSEAQRFPWDYDGIIAGAPPVHGLIERSLAADVWAHNVMQDDAGKPILDNKAIDLLHRKVIAACDENDGVKDGLIGDPRACTFDVTTLACGSGTGECLSAAQIETVKKVYSGPTEPAGATEFAGQLPGSELVWRSKVVNGAGFAAQGVEGLKYMLFDTPPGPAWNMRDFDIARDYKRFGISHAIHAADNPDLRKFKAAGGKLLMYVGWGDRVRPLVNIDYYETVERVMGGQDKTQDFMRLFVIPGMGHCFGGDGPDVVDYLSALETWVEQGQAPQTLIAAKVKPSATKPGDFSYWVKAFPRDPKDIAFTRPVYPYPLQTKYKGTGDPTKAENFEPVGPK
jgi:feruloyl esterase